jgi:hypothetical protein
MGTFIFLLVIAFFIFVPVYGIHSLRQRHKVRRLQIQEIQERRKRAQRDERERREGLK